MKRRYYGKVSYLPKYMGINGIRYLYHGVWADSEIIYKGYAFNTECIVSALYSTFKEVLESELFNHVECEIDVLFDEYITCNNGESLKNYLSDCIAFC